MKLYTEQQLLNTAEAIRDYLKNYPEKFHESMIDKHLTALIPIELPSDEEIKKVLIQYNDYLFTFIDKDEIGINVETEDVIKWYNETYGGGEQ